MDCRQKAGFTETWDQSERFTKKRGCKLWIRAIGITIITVYKVGFQKWDDLILIIWSYDYNISIIYHPYSKHIEHYWSLIFINLLLLALIILMLQFLLPFLLQCWLYHIDHLFTLFFFLFLLLWCFLGLIPNVFNHEAFNSFYLLLGNFMNWFPASALVVDLSQLLWIESL